MKLDKITWVAALLVVVLISSVVAQAPETMPAAPETSPNRAGTVRIGVAEPGAESFTSQVRLGCIQHLSALSVEIFLIRSRIPAEIEEEAQNKDCDFLLHASLSRTGDVRDFAYRMYAVEGYITVVSGTALAAGDRDSAVACAIRQAAGEAKGAVIWREDSDHADATQAAPLRSNYERLPNPYRVTSI
jgi:hypothetical protein